MGRLADRRGELPYLLTVTSKADDVEVVQGFVAVYVDLAGVAEGTEAAYGLARECLGFIQRKHAGGNTKAASELDVAQPRVATGHEQQLLPSGAQSERLGDLVRPQGTDGVPDREQRQGTDKDQESDTHRRTGCGLRMASGGAS